MPYNLKQYQTVDGRIPFRDWLLSVTDIQDRARIRARLDRLSLGHQGDYKFVGKGVCELRFHFGPGYRVYYGFDSRTIVVLLCGGDKSRQRKDIRNAQFYWKDYLERK